MYGISVSGATFGAIVAFPLVAWMTAHWTWRAPFLVTGIVGVLLSPVWLMVYRPPEQHPWITEKERQYVKSVSAGEKLESAWRWTSLLKTRTFWAVGIGRFISDSVWIFYVIWFAKFLTDSQGLFLKQMGKVGWIPFVFADVGFIGGGWLSGRLIKGGMASRRGEYDTLLLQTPRCYHSGCRFSRRSWPTCCWASS